MRLPKLCRNSDGRAFARYRGRRHYFGRHGSPEAEEAYRRFNQRILASADTEPLTPACEVPLLAELAVSYLDWPQSLSVKQQNAIRQMVYQVLDVYGDLDIDEFRPRKVRAWQQWLITAHDYSRTTIKKRLAELKRWFRWCVSRKLIPVERLHAIQTVEPLKAGRTGATEAKPVRPVSIADVRSTLPHLPPPVAVMVQIQYHCGMRPQDVVTMRLCDIDRRGDVRLYRPASHKNKHRGQELVKAIPLVA